MKTLVHSINVTIAHALSLVFLRSMMTGDWFDRLWTPLIILPIVVSLILFMACFHLADEYGDKYGRQGAAWAFSVVLSYLSVLLSDLPFGWVDPTRSEWTWFQVVGAMSVAIFAATSLYFILRNGWLDYQKNQAISQQHIS